MSPSLAAASPSDHRQGGFSPGCQNDGGDALDTFDFDAFLTDNVNESSGHHNDLSESDHEHSVDSDSNAQSWVDVALEPTGSGGGGMSPCDTSTKGRSPSHSDSEWELC